MKSKEPEKKLYKNFNSIEKRIYKIFRIYGFSKEEALWAARNDVNPETPEESKRKQILKMLKSRKAAVQALITYGNLTREEAVQDRALARILAAKEEGITDPEELENIFVGGS